MAVTGAGKTSFALLCIEEFFAKYPEGVILIVVPTIALLDQWYLVLLDDLGASDKEVGSVSGKKQNFKNKRFILAVINSMRILSKEISRNGPTMLIVDECHRAGSPKNSLALNGSFVASLGLSATPERQFDDGFERFIRPVLGEIIFEYSYEDAFHDNVIVPFNLVNVKFKLSSSEQIEYDKLSRQIAITLNRKNEANKERLDALLRRRARVSWNSNLRIPLAVKIALQHPGERIIIFHESIEHANQINKLLGERGFRSTIYHASLLPEKRRENLRLFKNGYYTCLVCCRALDEGLNAPLTSIGIIASSTSSLRQRIQRLGRVLRQVSGKSAATIYTLFATEPEKKRLIFEANKMQGIAQISWFNAQVGKKSG